MLHYIHYIVPCPSSRSYSWTSSFSLSASPFTSSLSSLFSYLSLSTFPKPFLPNSSTCLYAFHFFHFSFLSLAHYLSDLSFFPSSSSLTSLLLFFLLTRLLLFRLRRHIITGNCYPVPESLQSVLISLIEQLLPFPSGPFPLLGASMTGWLAHLMDTLLPPSPTLPLPPPFALITTRSKVNTNT